MSKITRRDFINGTLMAAGSSMLPFGAISKDALAALEPSYYPPALTGLRGSHPGSNDHAHRLAWAQRPEWGPTTELKEEYDLVVVGGGLSGLAAAYFYHPLQYTSVGLKNWRAIKEIGMGLAMSPGNMHQAVLMDFPVSMGGYEYTKTPDDPCVIQMISCPYGETVGAPRAMQFREARYRMLGLRFEDYEAEIRSHLNGMLPKGTFDFDRDVESIIVNRWAHGYTTSGPADSVEEGRRPFGRITIANSDSAPGNDAKTAMEMAFRAVSELG